MKPENFNLHLIDYLDRLKKAFQDDLIKKIEILSEDLIDTWEKDNQVFICGNGGSAANAIHIANDLHYGLGVNANRDGKGLKVEALPANSAVITCLANDTGYENIFSHQLRVKAQKDDLLIVLSGSGNSPNIVNVLKEGNKIGLKSYGILGFDGGKCKKLATNSIHFQINDMLISEDIQMIVFNICFQWIVKKFNNK
tara:strand:- start:258 stop:848 length:591 start_codon:yes stop_codon:yes gene_type:complete